MSFVVAAWLCVATAASAGEPQRLTTDGVRKLAPVFADGGDAVLFAMHQEPTKVALFKLKLEDRSIEPLDTSLSAHQFDPDVSADGRYLCFVLTANSPQSVLVIRDRTAQTEARYTPREARGTVRNPRLDLHHGRVVFSVSDPGGQQIAAVDLNGQNFKLITQSVGTNGWPAVSPDGERIAFSSSRDGSLQIYVMDADGDNARRLTDDHERAMRASWSPDGARIAFSAAHDGNVDVYVMNADGADVRRITADPERDDFPVWHPDGKRLLVVSERDGDCDLYLVDVAEQK
ncbi:MAG: LpqB family beta-propeller domain-containing protein [Planctomycetaceae bacterium]